MRAVGSGPAGSRRRPVAASGRHGAPATAGNAIQTSSMHAIAGFAVQRRLNSPIVARLGGSGFLCLKPCIVAGSAYPPHVCADLARAVTKGLYVWGLRTRLTRIHFDVYSFAPLLCLPPCSPS